MRTRRVQKNDEEYKNCQVDCGKNYLQMDIALAAWNSPKANDTFPVPFLVKLQYHLPFSWSVVKNN